MSVVHAVAGSMGRAVVHTRVVHTHARSVVHTRVVHTRGVVHTR
jgi:hypothetical protein